MQAEPTIRLAPAPESDAPPPAADPSPRDRAKAQPVVVMATVEPALFNFDATRQFCGGLSLATLNRNMAAGKMPPPVRIGGRTFFRIEDLRNWIAWDCCGQKEFLIRKAALRGKKG